MRPDGAIRLAMVVTVAAGLALPPVAVPSIAQASSRNGGGARPVVVELFTAQGCAGCPQANRTLESLAQTPDVIALTYGVNYWDYLGWPDTFARPEFAARHQAYRQSLKLRDVSTPQVVVDGRRQVSGTHPPALRAAIEAGASERAWPPEIEFRETGDRVGIGSGRPPPGGAEVMAVHYRPGLQTVEVRSGDNRGQSVRHVNVVSQVYRLGDWDGRPALYELPANSSSQDKVVVLVQGKSDRRIISAARQSEPARD